MKQVPIRLAEALEKICCKEVLEEITVSEIAAEAGLTRQVFYRYFDDKFELASWIHYADLYEAMKRCVEKNGGYSWRNATKEWLLLVTENISFYRNAFQSSSRREFQYLIKMFFYRSYEQVLTHLYKCALSEEQLFVLDFFCIGAMEKVWQWIANGGSDSVETLLSCLEASMPKMMWILLESAQGIPYEEMIGEMEEYLFKRGLLKEK